MNLKNFFVKDYIIALDIGSGSVKMLQFVNAETGLSLINIELRELSYTNDRNKYLAELLSSLTDIFKDIDLTKAKVIVGVSAAESGISMLSTPRLPEDELIDHVRLELKDSLFENIANCYVDYDIIDEIVVDGVEQYKLIAAFCPIDIIEEYRDLLNKAGIKPAILIPDSFALYALCKFHSIKSGELVCLFNVGHKYSDFMIVRDDELLFYRKLTVAGVDFTHSLIRYLGTEEGKIKLTEEEAEDIKRRVGIPDNKDVEMIDNKISTAQILSLLRAPLEQMTRELNRFLRYFMGKNEDVAVNSIMLSGRGACLKGFKDYISKQLSLDVKEMDSLDELNVIEEAKNKLDCAKGIWVARGLELTSGGRVNLLPDIIREYMKRILISSFLINSSIIFIFLTTFIYIGLELKLRYIKDIKEAIETEITIVSPYLKKDYSDIILEKEPFWYDFFKELSNIDPDNIALDELSIEQGIIKIKGTIVSDSPADVLAKFIVGLEGSSLFRDIKLVKTQTLESKNVDIFELICKIN